MTLKQDRDEERAENSAQQAEAIRVSTASTRQMITTIMLAMIVAVPPTLGAIANYVVAKDQTKKVDETLIKTDQIHVLVNSNLTAVKADLAIANDRIASLTKLLEKLQEDKQAELKLEQGKELQKKEDGKNPEKK
jgi:hypothetical protein